jgi:hypothetical protein
LAPDEAVTLGTSEDMGFDSAFFFTDCSCLGEGFAVALAADAFGSMASLLAQHLSESDNEKKENT